MSPWPVPSFVKYTLFVLFFLLLFLYISHYRYLIPYPHLLILIPYPFFLIDSLTSSLGPPKVPESRYIELFRVTQKQPIWLLMRGFQQSVTQYVHRLAYSVRARLVKNVKKCSLSPLTVLNPTLSHCVVKPDSHNQPPKPIDNIVDSAKGFSGQIEKLHCSEIVVCVCHQVISSPVAQSNFFFGLQYPMFHQNLRIKVFSVFVSGYAP